MSDHGRRDAPVDYRDRPYGQEGRSRSEGGYSRNSSSIFGRGDHRDADHKDSDRWSRDNDRSRQQGRFDNRHENRPDESRRHEGRRHEQGRFDRNEERQWSGGYEEGREGQGRERYGRDDDRDGLPVDETSRLIASNKVEGTAVYGTDNSRLGHIYNFMVNKYSGKVEYAVMSYGGMLGMGQRYYPLPWRILTYDTRAGGYRVDLSSRDLRDAPSFDRQSEPRFDQQYGERVHGWYGLDY